MGKTEKKKKVSTLRQKIYQSNPLLQARKGMSTIELRIFFLGLRGINPHLSTEDTIFDSEFKEVFIPTAKLTKIFSGNTWYLHNLDSVCKKLFDAKIFLRYEDGGFVLMHVFQKLEYVHREGLYIRFDELMRPYLLDLFKSRGFTQIDVEQIFQLTSPYAIRLVELMLQYQNMPEMKKRQMIERTIPIDELRFALDVDDNAYVTMSNFRRVVIDVPIREINEKTEYKMRYEVLKQGGTGGRVYAFKFFMDTSALPREGTAESSSSAIEKLKSLGFNEQSAQAIRDKCSSDEDCLDRITRATRSLTMKKKRSVVENELGYLRKYIEENWQSTVTKAKAKRAAKRSDQYPPPFREDVAKKKAAREAKEEAARQQALRTGQQPESIGDILQRTFPTTKKPSEPTKEDQESLPETLRRKEPELRAPSPEEFREGEKQLNSTTVDIAARAIANGELVETTSIILQMFGLTVERFKELYMR